MTGAVVVQRLLFGKIVGKSCGDEAVGDDEIDTGVPAESTWRQPGWLPRLAAQNLLLPVASLRPRR